MLRMIMLLYSVNTAHSWAWSSAHAFCCISSSDARFWKFPNHGAAALRQDVSFFVWKHKLSWSSVTTVRSFPCSSKLSSFNMLVRSVKIPSLAATDHHEVACALTKRNLFISGESSWNLSRNFPLLSHLTSVESCSHPPPDVCATVVSDEVSLEWNRRAFFHGQ